MAPETRDADISRPYPFFLAYPLEGAVEELGDVREWQVEWKWDGIRAQLHPRGTGGRSSWSRGEELMTERFPELEALGALLPDGMAIDGEVLPWKDGAPLPFAQMQRRIGRKVLGPRILARSAGGAGGVTICWNWAAKTCASAPRMAARAAGGAWRRPMRRWCFRPWWSADTLGGADGALRRNRARAKWKASC